MEPTLDMWRPAMRAALDEAALALDHGDVPVGAVVVRDGQIIAARHNERELTGDPTAHAEMLAVRDAAGVVGHWRLDDCTVVVTLEPCAMCAGALVNARAGRLVFGATDPKAGATGSLMNLVQDPRLNHRMPIESGLDAEECGALLREFFASRRRSDARERDLRWRDRQSDDPAPGVVDAPEGGMQ
jgi:tRNA(adenine34) deaminase